LAERSAEGHRGTLVSSLLNHSLWQTIEKHVSLLRGKSPWQGWGDLK